jgi:ABC-type bacteriocin/lantibiotic exporter with double-glycine peptidase domain
MFNNYNNTSLADTGKNVYIGELEGSPFNKFMQLLSMERSDIALVYSYAVINGLINLSLPLGIQAIMTFLMAGKVSTSWVVLIVMVLIGILFSSGLQMMQYSIIERLQQRIFTRATFEFAFRVPRMKLEAKLKSYAPELMNRFFDIMTVQKGLPKLLVDFSAAILQIIFGLILLAFYHSFFVLYGVLVVGIITTLIYITSKKGMETSLKESSYKYETAHWLEELARAMNIFKLAGYTDMPIKTTDRAVSKYIDYRKKHFKVLIGQYRLIVVFKLLMTGGLLLIGSALVFSKQINLGQFIASEIVIILILNSAEKLFTGIETMYDILTGVEKISHISQHPIEGEEGINFEDIDDGKGVHIKFNNVSYTYPGNHHMALKEITVDFGSGEKVCIMSTPGSGVSTLINLSASLLHEYTGNILINDITMRNLNLISLRSYVGENLFFNEIMNGTIAENISMGREDITIEDVLKVSEIAGLKEFVQGLPLGFNTKIIQHDMTIPSSITSKINIARSLAEKPRLFIMDEPFAGLAQVDKDRVSSYLTNRETPWTLIVSTNDYAMVSRCHRIVILDQGQIVADGTIDQVSQHPLYFSILNK